MEAIICAPKAPEIPTVPERQAMRLPDDGANVSPDNMKKRRRAIMAGLITSPQGALGSPSTAAPTLN